MSSLILQIRMAPESLWKEKFYSRLVTKTQLDTAKEASIDFLFFCLLLLPSQEMHPNLCGGLRLGPPPPYPPR